MLSYLLGQAVTIDQTVTLGTAGVIFRTTGNNVNLGLYSSVGGTGGPD